MDYKTICIEILKKNGPLLGSELNQILVSMCSVNENNARQIILRLKRKKDILSTDPVKFKHNQVLYFLPKQNIKRKLREILPDQGITLFRVYQALVEENGFLFWSEFAKICAGVVDNSASNKKTCDEIFSDLNNLGIVKEYDYEGIPVVVGNPEWIPTVDYSLKTAYKRYIDLTFTQQLTGDLLNWLEKMNLVGWNSSYINDFFDFEKGFNGFYFDAISYCYLWGLYRSNKKDDLYNPTLSKAGSPVVVESIIHRETKMPDITGFINRINNLNGPIRKKENFKIIPICFVDSIDSDAYELARRRGIMVINLGDVFGTRIMESLKELRDINPQDIDPTALARVLDKTLETGQDGKFGTLKGYVFNFLVASIFFEYGLKAKIGYKYVDPVDNQKKCECDIVISDDDYIIICEVKGYNSDLQIKLGETEEEKDSVKKFFERTCKIVERATKKTVIPIFITSAYFSEEALKYLELKNNSKKMRRLLNDYNFPSSIYYDRDMLLELFSNKQKFTEHKRILKEFFKGANNTKKAI